MSKNWKMDDLHDDFLIEMSKKWRVVAENNFEASLDVLCYFYRREIESSFRSENLTEVRWLTYKGTK